MIATRARRHVLTGRRWRERTKKRAVPACLPPAAAKELIAPEHAARGATTPFEAYVLRMFDLAQAVRATGSITLKEEVRRCLRTPEATAAWRAVHPTGGAHVP